MLPMIRQPSTLSPSAMGAAARIIGLPTAAIAALTETRPRGSETCSAQHSTRSNADPLGPTTRSTPPHARRAARGRASKPTIAVATAAIPRAPTKIDRSA